MHSTSATGRELTRRGFLGCAALYGVAGPLLVACSSDSGESGDSAGATAAAGASLVKAADVPVGGGVALTDLEIVVTQPTEGQFKAWSAVCTHQGAIVDKVEDGVMVCPLHQSKFSVEDGSPSADSPAKQPLAEIAVKVEGDEVVKA